MTNERGSSISRVTYVAPFYLIKGRAIYFNKVILLGLLTGFCFTRKISTYCDRAFTKKAQNPPGLLADIVP